MASSTISFSPPLSNGGSAITGYTVTSTPGNITATGTSSPIVVSGLVPGIQYTFTAHATNINGSGSESASSNSIVASSLQSYSDVGLILNSVQPAVDINNISLTLG
jgi:Fibronectin type III domain